MEKRDSNTFTGYITAIITVIIWGTTFIASKVLLDIFTPFELIFFRFSIGFLGLFLIYPKILKSKGIKEVY